MFELGFDLNNFQVLYESKFPNIVVLYIKRTIKYVEEYNRT